MGARSPLTFILAVVISLAFAFFWMTRPSPASCNSGVCGNVYCGVAKGVCVYPCICAGGYCVSNLPIPQQ